MTPNGERVERLLNPTSIAVVGASERSVWSSAFIANLERWRFPGNIHLINPRSPEVFGRRTAPTVEAVQGDVDHALICVPAALTMKVLADCDRAGVRSVTAIASGFSEAGPDGQALAVDVAAFCAEHQISMVGPNCYGFVNFNNSTVLSRNWLEGVPDRGSISLVTQSGQIGLSICGLAYARGADLRYLVSSGNELSVSSTDYFDYFVDDAETHVLGGALERIADPQAFERVAIRALEAGKPIVVCKMGRSAIGQRVAAAHTASVAGNAVVVETFLHDLGVIVVDTVDDLVETCGVLAGRSAPRGARTLFVGASGGAGGYFADLADGSTIELPTLSDTLRIDLADATGLQPDDLRNPMDLTAAAAGAMSRVVDVVAKNADIDVLVVQGEQPRSEDVHGRAYLSRVEANLASIVEANTSGLWACFASAGDREPTELGRAMAREHAVRYLHGATGVRALSHAINYGTRSAERLRAANARLASRGSAGETSSGVLDEVRADPSESNVKRLLAAYGVPTLQERVVSSADAAVAAADEIGYPVVLKVSSPDVLHKTDVGGVALDLPDAPAVRDAYGDVLARVRRAVPEARLAGAVVAPFVSGGVEVLLGVVVDPSLGPVVVVGAGGLYVELFGDTVAALPPFDEARAERMLRDLRMWKVLDGARGAPRADVEALCRTMVGFGALVHELADSLVALEINPLVVRSGAGGVVALDAVIELSGPDAGATDV